MEYLVALIQGIYFFVFGIWPILSMSTFLKITGPKTDLWLVKTVGLILAQINAEVNEFDHRPGNRERPQPGSDRIRLCCQASDLPGLSGRRNR
jgi:hypothetical protein